MWRRVRYALALLALCALATCPAAHRSCQARQRAREADDLLGYLAERVARTARETGKVPPLAAGPTPRPSCCEQGGTCPPDAATWAAPGWQALAFTVDAPHRFSFEYAPAPGGAAATLRATGDPDCDGRALTVELELTVSAAGVQRRWRRHVAEP